VTVKALYHYERIGLLKAARTPAGYRVYTDADLERLERISALRFLGLPLKKIGALLDGLGSDLKETLALQRRALEDRQRRIGVALEAIGEAERSMASGMPPGAEVLGRLIVAVEAQRVDLSGYFTPEALAELRAFHETARSSLSSDWMAEWRELQSDVLAAVGEDPAGPAGRVLAVRFQDFTRRRGGALPAFGMARADAPKLPSDLIRQFERSDVAKVVPFLMKASAALAGK
jgi:DNA-binding transcriptional MerR regulator